MPGSLGMNFRVPDPDMQKHLYSIPGSKRSDYIRGLIRLDMGNGVIHSVIPEASGLIVECMDMIWDKLSRTAQSELSNNIRIRILKDLMEKWASE